MKKILAVLAMLLSTAAYAEPSSDDSLFLSLDCVPFKHTGKSVDADPVYKITILVKTNEEEHKMKLWINHHTRSGEKYNRFEQYHDQQWTTVDHAKNNGNGTAWLWHATSNENAKVHMIGKIKVGHDATPWSYEERLYRAGQSKAVFEMISVCHSTMQEAAAE